MRARFFTKEAMRSLSRNAAPSVAALVTVMITTIVLGVFIPVTDATTGAANEIKGRLVVDVFVKDEASATEVATLRKHLEQTTNVKSIEFLSKQDALNTLTDEQKKASEVLGANPLPRTFRVSPKNPDQVEQIVAALQTGGSVTNRDCAGAKPSSVKFSDAAIQDVCNRQDEADKILSITNGVRYAMWTLALLLAAASMVLVANTIRLSIYARRREIEVMRMVGATTWFIRWPFVIEGLIVGFFGGLMAVLLLAIAKQTIVDPLTDKFALFAAPETMAFPALVAILLIASTLISAVGSGFTLRRFLRI